MEKGGSIVTCPFKFVFSFKVLDGNLQYKPSRQNGSLQRMFPFQNHFQHLTKQSCQHFCKCYAANEAHTQVSLMHVPFSSNQAREFSLPPLCTKTSRCFKTPQNGLVPTCDMKAICWFDKIGSHLCHMRCPALISGKILLFFFVVLTSQSTWVRYT